MATSTGLHPKWPILLDWLAIHGMETSSLPLEARSSPGAGYGLYALKGCDAATVMFSVPASALINKATLTPLYPHASRHLTAIQLMSLHLFFYKPKDLQPSSDPSFGPYITTLPGDFAFHPLVWLCTCSETAGHSLLSFLPANIALALDEVACRFLTDWLVVKKYIQEHHTQLKPEVVQPILHSLDSSRCKETFLWGWLNVNTRCLFYRLEQSISDKNNVTMCPLLDFANHTARSTHMSPQEPISDQRRGPVRSVRRDFVMLSPSNMVTKENDELFLKYGSHPNWKLFVEYGFVEEISVEDPNGGAIREASLDCEVLELFDSRGTLGAWMKTVLKDEGYWGDWTLHCHPSPAYPSFRLIAALRLYHLFPVRDTTVPSNADMALESWLATIRGTAENVSEENEHAWRQCLLDICRKQALKATSALHSTAFSDGEGRKDPPWVYLAEKNIKILWEEVLLVSSQVVDSILNNETF